MEEAFSCNYRWLATMGGTQRRASAPRRDPPGGSVSPVYHLAAWWCRLTLLPRISVIGLAFPPLAPLGQSQSRLQVAHPPAQLRPPYRQTAWAATDMLPAARGRRSARPVCRRGNDLGGWPGLRGVESRGDRTDKEVRGDGSGANRLEQPPLIHDGRSPRSTSQLRC